MHFLGRLGTYKYYNMDQCVAQALTLYAKLVGASRRAITVKDPATRTDVAAAKDAVTAA